MKTPVQDIRIADFTYPLDNERIASHPLSQRDDCLLLRCEAGGNLSDHSFRELPSLLDEDSLVVCNNTRVINARLRFRKSTGAVVEVFLLEPLAPADYARMFQQRGEAVWRCLIGNLKRWKEGELSMLLPMADSERELFVSRGESLPGNSHAVTFRWEGEATFSELLDAAGKIPIPPYLNRDTEDSDSLDYQTIYSKIKGSVAAPTAGLHFTETTLAALQERGIERSEVTLHVGAGTFQPVKSELIGEHPMHTEVYSVSRQTLSTLLSALRTGKKITAIGTTSVRTLESLPYAGRHLLRGESAHVEQWEAYADTPPSPIESLEAIANYMDAHGLDTFTGTTAIMIAPGFRWQLVERMVTNFHQPESTLLLLVSSFLGNDDVATPRWRRVYDHALKSDYRFLSYGDACLFERNDG